MVKPKKDDLDLDGEPLSTQSLKAAVWYTVSKIVEDEEIEAGVTASECFVAALAEAVFAQAVSLGIDLEAFSRHAGRSTINVDDVKLAVRRNETLYTIISDEAVKHGLSISALKTASVAAPKKPRATKVGAKKAAPVVIDVEDD